MSAKSRKKSSSGLAFLILFCILVILSYFAYSQKKSA